MNAFFVLLLIAFDVLKAEVSENATLRTVWKLDDSQLKLAYGSMLNISCISHDDCLLKHSNCNPLSKRCECDIGSLQDNSRCEVIQCKSSYECLGRFSNTVCMFGRCQCLYGLKANGQCVQLEVKQLPDWAISMIAVAALFSGLLGGRSQVAAQVLQHVMAIIGILAARVGNKSSTETDTVDAIPSSCESAEEKDSELHSKMLDSGSHLELKRISLVSMAPPSSSSPSAAFTARTSQVFIEEARSGENEGEA